MQEFEAFKTFGRLGAVKAREAPFRKKKNKCRDCSEAKWVILRRYVRGLFIILRIFGDKLFRGVSGWKAELTERICSDSSVGM